MKTLVTGGAGFIGSHLVELLLNEGHDVLVLDDLSGGREENFSTFSSHPNFRFEQKDIAEQTGLDELFQKIDWVFHLAGKADIVPSIEQPKLYYETNVTGTFNVLQAAKTAAVKRFVYAASSSCYGLATEFPTPETAEIAPAYPYALTKRLGEELVLHWAKLYELPAMSLRLFNVYGPRARTNGAYGAVFGVFLSQKLHQKPLTVVGDGKQTRDFTYVSDVAEAFYAAAKSDCMGEACNVGSGGHYSVNELVELLDVSETVTLPKRPGEPDCTFADIQKIKNRLNWSPQVSFPEGVAKTLATIEHWRQAPLWTPETIEEETRSWFDCLSET